MSPLVNLRKRVLSRGSYPEAQRIGTLLRQETTGGVLLIVAAAIAVIWANAPNAETYFWLRDLKIGPDVVHLHLSLGTWAADGLLAVFFFLVGLELKSEFVAGDLRDPGRAIVPVLAAAGGVVAPALIYAALNAGNPAALRGWAIPTATDIAFAVAVLAIIGSHLPSALRIFLLTLAVVDDLIAIVIIAIVYTSSLHWLELGLGIGVIVGYGVIVQRWAPFFASRAWAPWLILLPLGIVAWALMHASGIHATIAGVLLGFTVPVRTRSGSGDGLAHVFEHRFRPVSTAVAVPIFAFFAAGVALGGGNGLREALTDPIALGIIVGLIVGKPLGILLTTSVVTHVTRARLDSSVAWIDLFGVGLVAGIGFTVSLLVAELSFGVGTSANSHAKVGVLVASVGAALLASLVLVPRDRHYRTIEQAETVDADADGVPDVYEDAED